ncbi:ATP-binding cassette domain-containing protein [Thiothrix lacustris]|uniref:ATP-binding cassette domain-containing protein n=1 Tax=Thiothrix lacustris TaxID=525917 RepID=A0ABY9MP86_9GAMM|nr:ATP-binding cassette domain-containing protein [Thiothrix lacustris]WML89195.1 ATP-binding cassette domain-containing protein [Thiothrix lacustris]WMP19205.1 ATP-binding cassette domain-containing protein [Thiothrix lacustris]
MPELPILSVTAISKHYGKLCAVNQVSFQLGSGFHALLGPNGAGKSTLFQLLTGLFAPDQGDIHLNSISIRQHLPQALAQMGVVFQQPALDLDLSVQTNLDFYGRLHGMSKADIRTRSAHVLTQLEIADLAPTPCRNLSGGNRRKVELARALLTEPKLLLMDEATVGLDPASRATLLAYVHRLCREQGLCVLWATHLMDEAEQADQVLVMHKGKLLAQDTPIALMTQTHTTSLLEAFFQLSGESHVETTPTQL